MYFNYELRSLLQIKHEIVNAFFFAAYCILRPSVKLPPVKARAGIEVHRAQYAERKKFELVLGLGLGIMCKVRRRKSQTRVRAKGLGGLM